jgi:hypothetical protein
MADIKISQLTAKGSAIANTDLVEISESDGAGGYVTKSVTGANILASKQDTLVSGTNIKTINGSSVLGSGNLVVTPGVASLTATWRLMASAPGVWAVVAVAQPPTLLPLRCSRGPRERTLG